MAATFAPNHRDPLRPRGCLASATTPEDILAYVPTIQQDLTVLREGFTALQALVGQATEAFGMVEGRPFENAWAFRRGLQILQDLNLNKMGAYDRAFAAVHERLEPVLQYAHGKARRADRPEVRFNPQIYNFNDGRLEDIRPPDEAQLPGPEPPTRERALRIQRVDELKVRLGNVCFSNALSDELRQHPETQIHDSVNVDFYRGLIDNPRAYVNPGTRNHTLRFHLAARVWQIISAFFNPLREQDLINLSSYGQVFAADAITRKVMEMYDAREANVFNQLRQFVFDDVRDCLQPFLAPGANAEAYINEIRIMCDTAASLRLDLIRDQRINPGVEYRFVTPNINGTNARFSLRRLSGKIQVQHIEGVHNNDDASRDWIDKVLFGALTRKVVHQGRTMTFTVEAEALVSVVRPARDETTPWEQTYEEWLNGRLLDRPFEWDDEDEDGDVNMWG